MFRFQQRIKVVRPLIKILATPIATAGRKRFALRRHFAILRSGLKENKHFGCVRLAENERAIGLIGAKLSQTRAIRLSAMGYTKALIAPPLAGYLPKMKGECEWVCNETFH